MDTLALDNALNALIIAGKNDEAFLTYYDENVVKQENDEPESRGRDAWMRARAAFAKNIIKHDAKVLANAAKGDVSLSQWSLDLEIAGTGAMKMSQVAVRHWKNGRVVHERFYHK